MSEIILEFEKETENKVRWDAMFDDAPFELYIFKWRVPEPWPSKIRVEVVPITPEQSHSDHVTPDEAKGSPTLRSKHIIADVVMKAEHTKTIQYCPEGNNKDWEIGEPYIPIPLTHDKARRLRICVKWV